MPAITCKIIEVCVFSVRGSEPLYLLLKRSNDEEIYPGIWQFVSGSMNADETAYTAAHRELIEETQLPVRQFYVVPHVNVFYDADYDAVNISPLFAAKVDVQSKPRLSKEHTSYQWCSYDEAMRMLVWPGQKQGLHIVNDYIIGETEAGRLVNITDMIRREPNKLHRK